jgi:ribosomal-protein-alanine N-acetyltransferase
MQMTFEFETFPFLQTSRLQLISLEKKNAKQVLFLRSDRVVNQFIKRQTPSNIDDALAFIVKIQREYQNKESVSWAIHLKDDPLMIGSICLWNFSSDRKTAEVGYDLNPAYHNQGIMTEALQAILHFGFERLALETIKAFTHYANESSKRLLTKNGFSIVAGEKDTDNEDNVIFSVHKIIR